MCETVFWLSKGRLQGLCRGSWGRGRALVSDMLSAHQLVEKTALSVRKLGKMVGNGMMIYGFGYFSLLLAA